MKQGLLALAIATAVVLAVALVAFCAGGARADATVPSIECFEKEGYVSCSYYGDYDYVDTYSPVFQDPDSPVFGAGNEYQPPAPGTALEQFEE